MYNEGISISGDTLDTGVLHGVIAKNGNSYLYGETKLGVGRETAKTFLKENPKLIKQIREATMKAATAATEMDHREEVAA
jgi:recombination protein RecA